MDWSDDGSIEEHVGNEHVPEYLEQFLRSRGMKQRASGYSKRRIRLFYGLEEENPNPDEPDEDEESSLNESDEDDEDEVVLRNGSLSRYNTLLDTDGLEVGELVVDGESPVITDLNEQNEQNEQNEPMNERTNEPTNEPTNQQRNERRRGQTDEEVNELMNSPGFLPWVDLAPETIDRLLSGIRWTDDVDEDDEDDDDDDDDEDDDDSDLDDEEFDLEELEEEHDAHARHRHMADFVTAMLLDILDPEQGQLYITETAVETFQRFRSGTLSLEQFVRRMEALNREENGEYDDEDDDDDDDDDDADETGSSSEEQKTSSGSHPDLSDKVGLLKLGS